jgi:hypothetical protein
MMEKEELIKQCRYYKGEKECPTIYINDKERELWAAEYMICNDLSSMVSKKNLRRSFVDAVCVYVEKWDPYDSPQIVSEYRKEMGIL